MADNSGRAFTEARDSAAEKYAPFVTMKQPQEERAAFGRVSAHHGFKAGANFARHYTLTEDAAVKGLLAECGKNYTEFSFEKMQHAYMALIAQFEREVGRGWV